MLARPHKGVFWLIDGKIRAVPFDEQKYEYHVDFFKKLVEFGITTD